MALALGAPAAETIGPAWWGPCDQTASGAETAQVRVERGPAEVLCLCAHHYRELEWVLAVQGWRVTCDSRGDLARLAGQHR